MKKLLFIVVVLFFLCGHSVMAQVKEGVVNENNTNQNVDPSKVVLKVKKPEDNRNDTVGLTGIGSVSYIVSNTADGTTNTYRHSQRIILPLVSNAKNMRYQLVFYGDYDNIPYAVSGENGLMSIYYPAYMFNDMKQRLEQAFLQKKKVELRITQKKDGFREGAVIF